MASESESDQECIPDLNIESQTVKPYMFEPMSQASGTNRDNSESSSSSSSDENDSQNDLDDVSLWCTCQMCMNMPTAHEQKCCRDTNIVDGKIEAAGIDCITLHDGFEVNCLNEHVLEHSYWEYLEENGPLEEHERIHEVYRHLAYRRFVRWVYHKLGKKNRKVLPSCVVKAIRDRFPSQQYCGFKYPE